MYLQLAELCSPRCWSWHKTCSCSEHRTSVNDSITQIRRGKWKIYPIYHILPSCPVCGFQACVSNIWKTPRIVLQSQLFVGIPKTGLVMGSCEWCSPTCTKPTSLTSQLTSHWSRLWGLAQPVPLAGLWWQELPPPEWLGAARSVQALEESQNHALRYLEVFWFWLERFLGWSISVLSFTFPTGIMRRLNL